MQVPDQDLRRMIADGKVVELAEQAPVGVTVRFGVHLGFRYAVMPAESLGEMFAIGGTDDVTLRFLTFDDADGQRHMYGFTADDALELTSKLVGAFPGYITRARKLLDDMEEAGVGS